MSEEVIIAQPPASLDELHSRLAEAEARIETLETALKAVVYSSLITARYVTGAAEILGIDNLDE